MTFIDKIIKYIHPSKQEQFLLDFRYCFPKFHKVVEVELIRRRIAHLKAIGYSKKQIIFSVMNEFNKSERTCYRYLV